MLIFGHRGCAWDAPENTLAAINEGLRQGADGVEIDVRRSLDGVMVVMHDETLKRTAGYNGRVSETRSDIIKTLDAGSFKSPGFAGEAVPFLSEVLDIVPQGKLLQIEIKSPSETVYNVIKDIKSSRKAASEIIAICFDKNTLKIFKEELPQAKTAWINGEKKNNNMETAEEIINLAKIWHFDAIDFDCRFSVNEEFIASLKAARLGVFSWTVDDVARAAYLRDIGADGITTNRPGFIRNAFFLSLRAECGNLTCMQIRK